jgi:hypothetical protein
MELRRRTGGWKAALVAGLVATSAVAPARAADPLFPFIPFTWFAKPDPPLPNAVRDPHYGDTLFHFFQDRYFTSVTTLMVSQHFDRVSQHADEAEILRGGLLLSYGLHKEAGRIFTQLIERGAAPPVRDRAWYYLAKIRYQRGALAEAEQAVDQVGTALPPELEEDRVLLQANLLMARGDFAGAAGALNTMTPKVEAGKPLPAGKTGAALYARFNLGVALIKSGDVAGGSALLDQLGRAPAANEETRSLRDRANLALGFAALQDDRPEDARATLQRVRLNSLHANKALLGFGWAADALKQPKQALVPWTELMGRDTSDAAVLEARIAVPYALAQLEAWGPAAERYNEAIDGFAAESTALDESIAAIRTGKLEDGLLELNPGEEMGWFWTIAELPEMPHAKHLNQVLAQHAFQEAFKNYRDLRFLGGNLEGWKDKLVVYRDMLANRQRAFAERLPEVRTKAGALNVPALQQRRDRLAAELAKAEEAADGAAFADAKETELRARLEGVQQLLGTLANATESQDDIAQARERARRAAGALTWQLNEQYAPRVWLAKKDLAISDAELAEAQGRDAALIQAQRDEPKRFEAFAVRITELERRIDALIPRVAALGKEQQGEVQQLAVAELQGQKERLVAYATQARFAVAQIYDRANSGGGDRAAKP